MSNYIPQKTVIITHPRLNLGLYSLSGKTSYRKISWSLEAARFGFKLFQSLWNLAGTSAALLPRCLPNFRAIRLLQHSISRLRDFTRFGGKTSYRLMNRGPESIFVGEKGPWGQIISTIALCKQTIAFTWFVLRNLLQILHWTCCHGSSLYNMCIHDCDVWCRGLTTFPLYVGLHFGTAIVSGWSISIKLWIIVLHIYVLYRCINARLQ